MHGVSSWYRSSIDHPARGSWQDAAWQPWCSHILTPLRPRNQWDPHLDSDNSVCGSAVENSVKAVLIGAQCANQTLSDNTTQQSPIPGDVFRGVRRWRVILTEN